MPGGQRYQRRLERARSLYAMVRYAWGGDLKHLFMFGDSQDRLVGGAERSAGIDKPFASSALESLWQRRFCPARYDVGELMPMPPETLGGAYARHMTTRSLRPDFYDQVAPRDRHHYLRLRLRQTHDIWHVLAGFDTCLVGEVGLQGFYFGQFANGVPALILAKAIFDGVLHGDVHGLELGIEAFYEGYRCGRNAESLLAVEWEGLWAERLASLRERYHVDKPRCRAGVIGWPAIRPSPA